MYINFIEDRKALGYEVLKDTSCGIKLVLIIDSTVPRLLFYYNDNTRKIVAFTIETQDLITAGTYNLKDFSMFRVTKNLGRL